LAVHNLLIQQERNTSIQRKRILWISSVVLDITLYKTSRIEILRHLAKRGWDVTLVAMQSGQRHRLKNSRMQIISIPLRNKRPISSALYLLTLLFVLPFYIAKIKPNFVVIGSKDQFLSIISILLLLPFRRFKLVMDVRSTPVSTGRKARSFDVHVSLAKKLFDGITIITPLMKKEICRKFSLDPRFVGVWSSGASTTLFRYEKYVDEGRKLRKKLGLLEKFVVLHHGVLGPNRGILETVEAMPLIRKAHDNVILFLLGNGSVLNDLKALIKKKKLQDNVIIHDAVDYLDVPKYIAMCDVGIVPLPNISFWRYQCPLKLLEYLAMKKVVIITDIPAHREIVGNKESGVYISSTNPHEIADAVTYVYKNRDKLKEWGAPGREIITKKYNWEKAAKDLENFLLSSRRVKDA